MWSVPIYDQNTPTLRDKTMNITQRTSGKFISGINSALLLSATLLLAACSQQQSSEAEDRLAILEMQNRYVVAMDFFDADAHAAVFAEDGILDWARGEVIGRPAIREFMAPLDLTGLVVNRVKECAVRKAAAAGDAAQPHGAARVGFQKIGDAE